MAANRFSVLSPIARGEGRLGSISCWRNFGKENGRVLGGRARRLIAQGADQLGAAEYRAALDAHSAQSRRAGVIRPFGLVSRTLGLRGGLIRFG